MDLVDIPVLGNPFTWLNVDGICKSRLDRFLLIEKIVEWWKVSD